MIGANRCTRFVNSQQENNKDEKYTTIGTGSLDLVL
jgi:hypothetical protein